jgi:hypothetical protein
VLTVIVNSGTVPEARFSLYPEYPPVVAGADEDAAAGAAGAPAAGWNPEKITRN